MIYKVKLIINYEIDAKNYADAHGKVLCCLGKHMNDFSFADTIKYEIEEDRVENRRKIKWEQE